MNPWIVTTSRAVPETKWIAMFSRTCGSRKEKAGMCGYAEIGCNCG